MAVKGGRCQAHQRPSGWADPNRGSKTERGYGAGWATLRAKKLKADPDCESCGEPAAIVHHIDGNTANREWDNLMSVCKPCHDRLTAMARRRNGQRGG